MSSHKRSLDRFNGWALFLSVARYFKLSTGVVVFLCVFLQQTGNTQESITFNWEGYTYQADINWVIKHNNVEYRSGTSPAFDRTADGSFDLVVYFKFKYDSVPPDQNLAWGFQFAQNGGLISPASNEKRSRSLKQFQRFQLTGTGTGNLVISPKVWLRNRSNQFEVITLAQPFNINFNIAEGNAKQAANTPQPAIDSLKINPIKSKEIPIPVSEHTVNTEVEIEAYKIAMSEIDSTQKIKALLDFVDKFSPDKPKSPLVAEAIKNVPLGTSLPKTRGDGTYSYTLNYAVKPEIDSSNVRGWEWDLSRERGGQYQLTLRDLGDSVHLFKIADVGKNAPFNLPREIRPFDKIQVGLATETSEAFQIRFQGGVPPFIIFLSQNRIPKARFIVTSTDTIWTINKDDCLLCKNGKHTLEVYNSDFSTLLLRVEDGINIFRINYYYLGLTALALILLVYFFYKPLTRVRQRYIYEKRLRDIEAWEKRDAEDGH